MQNVQLGMKNMFNSTSSSMQDADRADLSGFIRKEIAAGILFLAVPPYYLVEFVSYFNCAFSEVA